MSLVAGRDWHSLKPRNRANNNINMTVNMMVHEHAEQQQLQPRLQDFSSNVDDPHCPIHEWRNISYSHPLGLTEKDGKQHDEGNAASDVLLFFNNVAWQCTFVGLAAARCPHLSAQFTSVTKFLLGWDQWSVSPHFTVASVLLSSRDCHSVGNASPAHHFLGSFDACVTSKQSFFILWLLFRVKIIMMFVFSRRLWIGQFWLHERCAILSVIRPESRWQFPSFRHESVRKPAYVMSWKPFCDLLWFCAMVCSIRLGSPGTDNEQRRWFWWLWRKEAVIWILLRRLVVCSSMNCGSKLSEMSSWFCEDSIISDQNARQFDFSWVSHLWHSHAIALVKHCRWKLWTKPNKITDNCVPVDELLVMQWPHFIPFELENSTLGELSLWSFRTRFGRIWQHGSNC